MKQIMAAGFYNALLLIFALVDLSKWLFAIGKTALTKVDSNKIKRDTAWGQKFGLMSPTVPPKQPGQQRYLIHCASMGEVIAAMPLLSAVLEQNPELTFVLTTNTLTGKEQALKLIQQQQFQHRIYHAYLPIDLPWLMRGLLRKQQIDKLLITEVELWPNLLLAARKLGIDSAIVNGRLTDSSRRGYEKFAWLAQPMLHSIKQIFVRNQKDYDNYSKLGLKPPALQLVGNIKFDIPLPDSSDEVHWREQLGAEHRTVIVAGSTHDGEETALLQSFQQLQTQYADLLLVIAPRHPHRFAVVTELVKASGLSYANTSLGQRADSQTQVVILDQMGVLSKAYSAADIVFIGGSLVKKGGHNPIEASAYAKPVLMGQYIYNNPEIIDTLAEGKGLLKVKDETELQTQLQQLLGDKARRLAIGQQGMNTIKQNAGVIAKLVEAL